MMRPCFSIVLSCATVLIVQAGGLCAEGAADLPNVVLISIDTLRADHLGCYGYSRRTSPVLDALAQEGVLFENAYASSSWTLPSHASMFTGLLPASHRAITAQYRIRPDLPTLAQCFQKAGYATGAFVSAPLLNSSFGFDKGFDHYDDFSILFACQMNLFGDQPKVQKIKEMSTSLKVVRMVRSWLRPPVEQPVFLFVHFFDCHTEYRPPNHYRNLFMDHIEFASVDSLELTPPFFKKHGDEVVALYDGEIAFVDNAIGDLMSFLGEAGILKDCILVITSDHGEEFFEHGGFHHGRTLYEESVRVPLLIVWENHIPAGIRRDEVVSNASLMPTVLDLVRIPVPENVALPSFHNLLGEDENPAAPASEPVLSQLFVNNRWIISARDNRRTVLWKEKLQSWQFYDRLNDRYEKRNLYDELGDIEDIRPQQDLVTSSFTEARESSALDEWPALPDELLNALEEMEYIGK